MQFEVNGHEYFLAFAEKENCYYVLEATDKGVSRIPVYEDSALQEWDRILQTGERRVQ
jgi:hypothetical protein